jgi:hypothetical protein
MMRPMSTGSVFNNDEIKGIFRVILGNLDNHLSAARSKSSTVRHLGQINQMNIECRDQLRTVMLETDFLPLFLRRVDVIVRFESLSEFSLNLLVSVVTSSLECDSVVVDQFVCGGGIIYILINIKSFLMSNRRICESAGRLLNICIRTLFSYKKNRTVFTDFDDQLPLTPSDYVHPRYSKHLFADIRQQLVLHGVASMLPRLVQYALDPFTDEDYFADLIASKLLIQFSASIGCHRLFWNRRSLYCGRMHHRSDQQASLS